jgi:virginiamycin B lyase
MAVTEYNVGPGAYGVAIAAADNGGCWATLWATSSVVRLDADGRLAEEISFQAGAEPHGLALAPGGTPWVALEAGYLAHLTAT